MQSKSIELRTEHCAPNRELRLSSLFRLIQEIAISDTESLGYPKEKTLDRGLLWVVGKQRVEIARLPKYGERVELSTHPGPKTPFLFPRYYALKQGNETLLSAASVWTLIDNKTRQMINPMEKGIVIDGENLEGDVPFQFPMKSFPLPGRCRFLASWRDCDLNGHLNNASYLDLAELMIPDSYLLSHTPSLVEIAYRKEIPLGEEAEVEYGNKGNEYVFSCPSFFLRIAFR